MILPRLTGAGLWRPPRKLRDSRADRAITWLELFYDLVYVVLIARAASHLARNMAVAGIVGFVMLFILIWVVWFSGAYYYDLHGNRDLRTRTITFLQMFAVAAMAVFAGEALAEGGEGFALATAVLVSIQASLWWSVSNYESSTRAVTRPVALSGALAALLFVLSAALVGAPRYVLWGTAVTLMLVVPAAMVLRRGDDRSVGGPQRLPGGMRPALAERFALLTLIVLGEFVSDVVLGVAEQENRTWLVGGLAALSMLIAIALWWIYFDLIARHVARPWLPAQTAWYLLHLPLTMGMAAAGAAALRLIAGAGVPVENNVRWVLCGGMSLTILAVAGLMQVTRSPLGFAQVYRKGGRLTAVCGFLLLLLGFAALDSVVLLLAILLLLLIPVLYGLQVWMATTVGEDAAPELPGAGDAGAAA